MSSKHEGIRPLPNVKAFMIDPDFKTLAIRKIGLHFAYNLNEPAYPENYDAYWHETWLEWCIRCKQPGIGGPIPFRFLLPITLV